MCLAMAPSRLRLGANLEDALHSLIEDVVSNDDAALRQRWFATTDFLSNPAKKMLVVTMRDRVLNGGAVGGLVNLLAASDEQLVKLGDFEGRADDAVRHVLRELVGSEAGESWLVAHAQTSGAWVSRSDAISHDYLAGRLKEMWLAADETHRQRLAGLAEAWSLGSLAPPPPPPEVDESATEIPGETERAEGDS